MYYAAQAAIYQIPRQILMLFNTSPSLWNYPGLRIAVFGTVVTIAFHLVIAWGLVRFSDRLLAFITSDFAVKEPPTGEDKQAANS